MRASWPLTITAAILLATACRTGDRTLGIDSDPATPADPVTVVDAIDVDEWPNDPVSIHTAAVFGDKLRLTASHAGGCRVHGFELVASSDQLALQPPRVGVLLAHDRFGDQCKSAIPVEFEFDLVPLKRRAHELDARIGDELLLQIGELQVRYSI
jgi:hypothetical protein